MTPLETQFSEIAQRYPRIAITGGPRCGKTTLANFAKQSLSDRPVLLCEDFRAFDIATIPEAMIGATNGKSRFIIESVHLARALRKGMQVDAVIYLHKPRVPRIKGQITMAKGVHTVFKQWRDANRGVPVFVLS